MKNASTLSFKPLSLIPDDEDLALHKYNCSADIASRRLRELVPLLDFLDCTIEEVGPKRTVLSLPLLPSAMNQNGTQQAAVFYLIADYTLGVGIFGVLPGCYVTGVHDRCNALPVQYWLKSGTVHHLAPGTGSLRAEVQISPDDASELRRSLALKGRGELSEVVRIYQDDDVVAEAHHTMGIYADVPRAAGVRANIFQLQNMKTSALMIAGLRGDPLSREVAGGQGRAIASRMALIGPQLPSLVRGRTIQLEKYFASNGHMFAQVLVLGVGFDPKPVRYSNSNQRWFGLDLRDMLRERKLRFERAAAVAENFVPVIGDMLSETWDNALREAGFLPDAPTLVIAEGISMYFSEAVLAGVFRRLRELVHSPETRFWIDHVTYELFDLDLIDVRSFLSSMGRLGEPFITGFDDPSVIAPNAWALAETTSAAAVTGVHEPIHEEYRFSILKPR